MGLRSIPVLAAILLAGCTGPYSAPTVSAKTEGKPVPVRARAVALETIPEIITATGELSAEDIATISAKVAGRVEKLNVDRGSVVEQGQILAELEKDDYAFRVKQTEALVEQTRAQLGLPDPESVIVLLQFGQDLTLLNHAAEIDIQLFH